MKQSKTAIILAIAISVILFLTGFLTSGIIYVYLLPKVDNVFYQDAELNGHFISTLIFSVTLALIPILLLLTWRLSPITEKRKKAASVVTVVLCMATSLVVRQQIIKSYLSKLAITMNLSNEKSHIIYPIDKVNFELYLVLGLCVGCVVSYFLYKQEKITNIK